MIPNWALEKLGAGLIWKRIHASSPKNRLEQQQQQVQQQR